MPPTDLPALLPFPVSASTENHSVENEAKLPLSPDDACVAALAELRASLGCFLELPGETQRWTQLLAVRRHTSETIAKVPRKQSQSAIIHAVHAFVREMGKSGVHDHGVETEDLVRAEAYVRKGWPGLLAAMLLVPAWQWPAAPLVMEVPDWLRADYVRWLFSAPQNFTATGQADAYAAFVLKRLEELVRWLKRGPGATEELRVLGAYASHSSLMPLCGGTADLRPHAELRGQLLLRAMGRRDDQYAAPLKPRAGRRLRIGIIHRHIEATPEIYATLPLYEYLDPERFEVILYTYVSDFSVIEEYCRQKAGDLIVLPADIKDQLALLRNASLDVLLFGANLAADCNVVTRLALHRVAPLQVANHSSGVTSGLAEIDLYLTGALAGAADLAAQFSERLAVMPGPTHVYNLEADREERRVGCMRSDFGLPDDAMVFVSTASHRKITPEVQRTWARILSALPGSFLLLHPFHPGQLAQHTVHHFHSEFEVILQSEGVDPERLVASTVDFPSRADVQGLVALGDVYLDTFPFSGVDELVNPLALGLPVVTQEGEALRSRTGTSLLRSLGLNELIAASPIEYQAIAARLALETAFRKSCQARIRAEQEQLPAHLDGGATSRTFGELMEQATDELAGKGRSLFRATRTVLN